MLGAYQDQNTASICHQITVKSACLYLFHIHVYVYLKICSAKHVYSAVVWSVARALTSSPLGTGWQRVRCTLCHVYWTLRHGIGQRVSVASSCASLIKVYADPAEEFTNETRWFLTKYSMGVSWKVYNYSFFVIKYGDDSCHKFKSI